MLKIGIHENIVVNKVTTNDKGTLVIGFTKQVDPLEALNAAGQTDNNPGQDFLIFPPSVLDYDKNQKDYDGVIHSIKEVKNQLDHIASSYLTEDKRKWNLFANIGLTKENTAAKILEQSTVDKIYVNMVDQFIKMMTPVIGLNSKPLRLVLPRKSKTSGYSKLRTKYLSSQPFLEPMDANPSKVAFSKYEIENGLHKPLETGSTQTVDSTDAKAADSLFSTN